MDILKCVSRTPAVACLAMGLMGFGAADAHAANIVVYPGADFSITSYPISFDGGAATYTMSASTDGMTTASVSTGGTAMVDSFFGAPTAYQLGSLIGDNPYETFSAFSVATGIPYSQSEDSIGLEFKLADGIHYGYVTTFGTKVLQYGYNDTPGGTIATGAAAPEAATWVMMLMGLGGAGMLGHLRRKRSSPAADLA